MRAIAVKHLPAKAQNIQSLLDVVLQILNVIQAIASIFGINLHFFGGTTA